MTQDLVDKDTLLRSRKRAISCKQVFKQKCNTNSSKHFKARLVIKGYKQKHSIDYKETFVLVAKFVIVQLLFVFAALYNQEINQIDVIIAFFNPILYKEVFIELPEGFSSTSKRKQYYCLNKSLYKLKQAPQAQYKDIDTFLTGSLGLTYSKEDPNLYINYKANLILLLQVDNILLFSSDKKAV